MAKKGGEKMKTLIAIILLLSAEIILKLSDLFIMLSKICHRLSNKWYQFSKTI